MHDLLRRLAAWLNASLHILATDEESAYFSRVDRDLRRIERLGGQRR